MLFVIIKRVDGSVRATNVLLMKNMMTIVLVVTAQTLVGLTTILTLRKVVPIEKNSAGPGIQLSLWNGL